MNTRCAAISLWLALAGTPVMANCAAGVEALRKLPGAAALPLHWTETSMDDGKPMVLQISEVGGLLHLRFTKSGEGLWAEGTSLVCAEGGRLVVRFEPASLRPGPATPWLLRQSLAAGATFELHRSAPMLLVASTPGWRGRFAADPVALRGGPP